MPILKAKILQSLYRLQKQAFNSGEEEEAVSIGS